MIEGAPENIIWCYGIYQPAYDEMLRNIPNIHFVEGVPSDLESMINPSERNLVVIDDLMQELSNDPRITSLFTKGCHHRNLSVIFILQNIFHRGKELRDVSLNCHYLVLFKSPRDSSQVNRVCFLLEMSTSDSTSALTENHNAKMGRFWCFWRFWLDKFSFGNSFVQL